MDPWTTNSKSPNVILKKDDPIKLFRLLLDKASFQLTECGDLCVLTDSFGFARTNNLLYLQKGDIRVNYSCHSIPRKWITKCSIVNATIPQRDNFNRSNMIADLTDANTPIVPIDTNTKITKIFKVFVDNGDVAVWLLFEKYDDFDDGSYATVRKILKMTRCNN